MNDKTLSLQENAKKFNVILSAEQLIKFENFANFITEYNKHTNLLSSNDINLIYEKHFLDCISIFKILDKNKSYKILDIGSGGGFPCIPVSIIANNSNITAIDSTNKKVEFLNQASSLLKLNNFNAINERAEKLAYKNDFRESFDIVTARAVGNLAMLSEICLPYLKIGGKFIAYKSLKINEEIENAQKTIDILGGNIVNIFEYEIEIDDNFKRNLLVIEKTQNTPDNYPRAFGVIKNNPLK